MIYLGTSGFSYNDWAGRFYPQGLPRREWLSYYAQEFNACEINSTYYALPRLSTLEAMARQTGEGFLFVIKAHQSMTHQREADSALFLDFRKVLEPVLKKGKLGCILAQFPYSFRPGRSSRDYLEHLQEGLEGLPLVIEFRHASWLRPEVFAWMRERGLGFCCVDEPPLPNLLPPLAEVTGKIAYVRFHGRNAAKWWHHEHAYERYDYSYSDQELLPWVEKIRHMDRKAELTFVFANNHFQAKSIDTVRRLRQMLGQETPRLFQD